MHPGLRLYYETKLGGKIVTRKRASRSFVRSYLDVMAGCISQVNTSAVTITGASTGSYSNNVYGLPAGGGAGSATSGIVVGTGNTAVTASDTKLQTQIAHGNGAGQLAHLAQTLLQAATVAGSGSTFKIQRLFTNNTGATITVKEIGVYAQIPILSVNVCIIRDVLAVPVDVLAGQTYTVVYTFQTVI